MSKTCPLCLNVAITDSDGDRVAVECQRCGEYTITGTALVILDPTVKNGPNRHLLSGLTREHSNRGTPLLLTSQNLLELLRAARPPRDPFDAIDKLLLHIVDRTASPSAYVKIDIATDYPLVYAPDRDDLDYYLTKAEELGYLEMLRVLRGPQIRLALKGWQRVDELRRTRVISNQAFVAMWFNAEVRDAWMDGIEPALSATGYIPIRLDFVEHNERIDDRIIAEIRRSGLVIADFTGDRGGVYFEAGFAMGLGIPVIWTCRKDYVEKLHFDTRQPGSTITSSGPSLRIFAASWNSASEQRSRTIPMPAPMLEPCSTPVLSVR